VVRIALCSPLPPTISAASQLAEQLLPALSAATPVEAYVENPFLAQPWTVPASRLFPLCDLTTRLAQGDVDVPVYLLDDGIQHVHQLRYAIQHPGVLVFFDADLHALNAACQIVLDALGNEPKAFISESGDGREPLAKVLGLAACSVVASDTQVAHRLQDLLGQDIQIHLLSDDLPQAANQIQKLAAESGKQPMRPTAGRPTPKVTALVVSYNSKDIIEPCLQSLIDQDYPNLEILVVDNASADGTAEFIRKTFPSVRVIDSGSNLGFAGGNNLGFEISDAEYFVLLNQDAIALRNFITELTRVATLDPRIAAVAGKMLMDRCPSLLNSAGSEINEAGWGGDRLVGDKDDDSSPLPIEVFGGCGGALLLRSEALRKVGGFDTKFFMYYEDTDLCWRFRAAGYHNYYAPLAVVRHDFHGDTVVDPEREFRRRFMSERNRLQTWFKNTDGKTLRNMAWKLFKHDRGRLKSLDAQAAAGPDKATPSGIARMIRKAWMWNFLHGFGLVLRRYRTQRLRTASRQDILRLIQPGYGEGGHQGDVGIFQDRFSAVAKSEITIGTNDHDCLGSGWHGVEQPPGAVAPYRWTRGRAWFYLRPTASQHHLVLQLASPIEPHETRILIEGIEAQSLTVLAEVTAIRIPIPPSLPRDQLLECQIETPALRPIDRDMGPDLRELGVIVFSMKTE
jgi:GT2 family glycosyltransferase